MNALESLRFVLTTDASGAIKGFESAGAAAEVNLKKAETGSEKAAAGMTKYGAMAVAGAGIVLGALVKLSGSYEEHVLTVDKLSKATGLNVDQASRFTDVAKDLVIGVDGVTTMLGKMNKAAENGSPLFAQLGTSVAHLKNGGVDVQGTFLNVVDALNKSGGAAAHANELTTLFGKGWQSNARLIGESTDQIKAALAGVNASQVFNEADVARAKAYEESINQMKDAFEGLGNELGKSAAPVIAFLARGIGDVASGLTKLNELTGGTAGGILAITAAGVGLLGIISVVSGSVMKFAGSLTVQTTETVTATEATTGLAVAEGELAATSEVASTSLTGLGMATVGVGAAVGIAALALAAYNVDQAGAKETTEQTTKAMKGLAEAADSQVIKDFDKTVSDLASKRFDYGHDEAYSKTQALKEATTDLANADLAAARRTLDLMQAEGGHAQAVTLLSAAIAKATAAQAQGKQTEQEYGDAMTGTTGDVVAATEAHREFDSAAQGALVALSRLTADSGAAGVGMNYMDTTARDAALSQAQLAAATGKTADHTRDLADALDKEIQKEKDAADAADNQRSAQKALADGSLAYQRDQLAANDAVTAYTKAAKTHKAGSEEMQKATLDAVSAISQQAASFATLNGDSLDSEAGSNRFKLALQNLANETKGPLHDAIEAYIAQLKRIPSEVSTSLIVNGGSAALLSGNGGSLKVNDFKPANRAGTESMTIGSDPFGVASTSTTGATTTSAMDAAKNAYNQGRLSYQQYRDVVLQGQKDTIAQFGEDSNEAASYFQTLSELDSQHTAEVKAAADAETKAKQDAQAQQLADYQAQLKALRAAKAKDDADAAVMAAQQALDAAKAEQTGLHGGVITKGKNKGKAYGVDPAKAAAAAKKVADAQAALDAALGNDATAAGDASGYASDTPGYEAAVKANLVSAAAGFGDPTGALQELINAIPSIDGATLNITFDGTAFQGILRGTNTITRGAT